MRAAKKSFFFSILFLAGLIYASWQSGWIQNWVQKKVVEYYLSEIAPGLPFEIKALKYDSSLSEILKGKIKDLDLTLKWNEFFIHMKGPLQLKTSGLKGQRKLDFHPEVTVQRQSENPSDPFSLKLFAQLHHEWKKIQELKIDLVANDWRWASFFVQLQSLKVKVKWESDHFSLHGKLKDFLYEKSDEEVAILKEFSLNSSLPLSLSKPSLSEVLTVQTSGKDLELLKDDIYLSPPLKRLPLHLSWDFSSQTGSAEIGRKKELQIEFSDKKLSWKSTRLSLQPLYDGIFQSIGEDPPKNLTISGGTLQTKGSILVNSKEKKWSEYPIETDTSLLIDELKIPDALLSLEKLRLKISGHSQQKIKLNYSADRAIFRKFSGPLSASTFLLNRLEKNLHFEVFSEAPLNWSLPFTEIKFNPLQGTIQPSQYSLKTSLMMNPVSLPKLIDHLCLSKRPVPKGLLTFHFPQITLDPNLIQVDGNLRLQVFSGEFELSDLKVFDYLSTVPETQFNARWRKLELAKIGTFLNFGEMDGWIEGHAREVVLQEFLPTRYRFLLKVVPQTEADIVFSPTAMKNVVQIFAGNDLDTTLPGIAQWLAFGWPSRVLGGYNIDYAGISLHSAQGLIVVRTLDPPEIFEKEQKRFILYGRRFKIPIQSPHYPVTLGAPEMANFVQHIIAQLDALQTKPDEEETKEIEDELESCHPDH